ncbi:MAG TPA: hypothetical protein VNQ90_10220 [Chthoniobacteraceae bacterium]|nr:hypothetical protein [Chthoniobacteraceae bacterium]
MKRRRLIGYTEGLLISEPDGEERTLLYGEDVVALASAPNDPRLLLAGTYGRGVFRSTDGGANWKPIRMGVDFVRTLVFSEHDPRVVYLGAEPAELFRSRDGGETWESLNLRRLPESPQWSLPYSPRGGALRTIVLHPQDPLTLYGGIEQGGVVKSTDGGANWKLDAAQIHKDVHFLSINPQQPETLLAATGGGLFLSRDGAATWSRLIDDYTRAVLIDPLHPENALAGPALDVGEGGRIIQSRDGGETWKLESDGLHTPMDDMVEFFVIDPEQPERLFALCSDGALLESSTHPLHWEPVHCGVEVQCLLFVDL